MMGNLFYRGVSTVEINNMSYFEMKDWNNWHEIIADAQTKAVKKAQNGE